MVEPAPNPEFNPEPQRLVIRVMPDKETLEEFINNLVRQNGSNRVYFDIDKGEFVTDASNA